MKYLPDIQKVVRAARIVHSVAEVAACLHPVGRSVVKTSRMIQTGFILFRAFRGQSLDGLSK